MSSQHDPRSAALRARLTVDAQTRDRVNQSGSSTAAKTPQASVKPPFSEPTKRLASVGGAAVANLMVGYRLDPTFRALADPTRRALLARLAGGEKRVGELTRGFAMSETAVAKHLALLEKPASCAGTATAATASARSSPIR